MDAWRIGVSQSTIWPYVQFFNQFSDFGSSRCKKVICFPYFTKPTPGYTLENHPVPACIHTASNGEMEASRWEATLSLSALFSLLLYTFFFGWGIFWYIWFVKNLRNCKGSGFDCDCCHKLACWLVQCCTCNETTLLMSLTVISVLIKWTAARLPEIGSSSDIHPPKVPLCHCCKEVGECVILGIQSGHWFPRAAL